MNTQGILQADNYIVKDNLYFSRFEEDRKTDERETNNSKKQKLSHGTIPSSRGANHIVLDSNRLVKVVRKTIMYHMLTCTKFSVCFE